MAFGKKKAAGGEAQAPPLDEPAAQAGGEAIGSELFSADVVAADAAEPAYPEAEPAAQAPPDGSDAPSGGEPDLLSMFQTSAQVADDRAALLELAGEVELDDLLEDLQTVAAAISSKR